MIRRLPPMLLAVTLLASALAVTTPAHAQSETVIAFDNFDRANETPFAVGGNWGKVVAGNFPGFSNLIGNEVRSASNEGIYYWQGPGAFSSTRQFAREQVVQKNGEVGLVLLGGPDQAIMVGWGPPGVGNTVYIYWYSNGQDRGQLATAPSSLSDGDIIEAVLDNGIIYAKVNGVTVKSVPNTTTLTSGSPGFITYLDPSIPGQVSILDDWEAGTPASYSISGTILEGGNGLGGVHVAASGGFSGSTTTAGDGTYTLTGIAPGATSITLTPTLSGHSMSPLTRTVAGPANANVTGQDFTSTDNGGFLLTTGGQHGTVSRNPDLSVYSNGTQVTLTPVPDASYQFSNWSGDVPAGHETDNPLAVTMDQDRTISAAFLTADVVAHDEFNRANESPFALGGNWTQPFGGGNGNLLANHVEGGSGEALYHWQGAGSFVGSAQFARARVVSPAGQLGLVLLSGPGRALVSAWTGGTLYVYWYSGGANQGALATAPSTLHAGDEIEASIENGTITVRVNGVTAASTPNTTSLPAGKPGFETFQAGGAIDDWRGGTPSSFTISGTITENGSGLGGVQVAASGGISATTTTAANGTYGFAGVPPGTGSVVITPTLPGHTMSPTTLTVPGPISANVTGQDFTSTANSGFVLTVTGAHGTVTRSPNQSTYNPGTLVTLTANPYLGYKFAGWSGDVPAGHETDNPLAVTMNQDRTMWATFVASDVVAFDHFNRPDETPLAVSGSWAQPFGGGTDNLVATHVAGASGEALYYWQGAGTFDNEHQFARAHVVSPAGQVGLVLLGGPGQALVTAWSGGALYIYWYSGGAYQGNLTTVPSTLNSGDKIEVMLHNGTIYAKINGATVASALNTTTLTSGKPGFETYQSGGAFDNWEAGPDDLGPVAVEGGSTETVLHGVWPNPVRGGAQLHYSIGARGPAHLAIYSVDGRRVRTLAQGVHEVGQYHVAWDGTDEGGAQMKAGVFFIRLETAAYRKTHRIAFVR